jgi:hypothetical protein
MRDLDIDVAKARLLELVLRSRVGLDGTGRRAKLVASDPSPTDDLLLAPVIADLVRNRGLKPWDAAERTKAGCTGGYLERLERDGLIRSEQSHTRFLNRSVTRYYAAASATMPIHERIVNAWATPAEADAHDIALLLVLAESVRGVLALQAAMPTPDDLGSIKGTRRWFESHKAVRRSASDTIVKVVEAREPWEPGGA